MKKALLYGIVSSLFFAFTFILNRSMNLTGGYWMWSACLRYFFTLPIMALILLVPGKKKEGEKSRIKPVLEAIRQEKAAWFLWSTVGFGLFYLPLSLASVFGESWLVAASWQMTIVAGVLLTPLSGRKIPWKNLGFACLILVGIAVLQIPHMAGSDLKGNMLALIPIVIAAFAYPLGNRKMMEYCTDKLDTIQRVFGMTLCSMPFWIVTGVVALCTHGMPGSMQMVQSASVALFSGVIATILFFHATDMVRDNAGALAVVEATQCGEVIFTLLGGVLFLGDALPGASGWLGLVMIVAGMIMNSIC